MQPAALAALAENAPSVPKGRDESAAGYGVFGVGFDSGDVLAMRRFTGSSVGPGYTSLWHRSPQGEWSITTDVPSHLACPRYFGADLARAPIAPIDIRWTGPRAFTLTIRDTLRWDVQLKPTMATRMLNGMGRMMPDSLWRSRAVLGMMARMAGPMLGAGKLTLTGRTSNGQSFVANPMRIWRVAESRAAWEGRDLGKVVPLKVQPALGGFRIPRAPIFAVGRTFFEPFDATRHLVTSTRAAPPSRSPAQSLSREDPLVEPLPRTQSA